PPMGVSAIADRLPEPGVRSRHGHTRDGGRPQPPPSRARPAQDAAVPVPAPRGMPRLPGLRGPPPAVADGGPRSIATGLDAGRPGGGAQGPDDAAGWRPGEAGRRPATAGPARP